MKKLLTCLLSFILTLALTGTSIYAESVTDLKKKQNAIKNAAQQTQEQLNATKQEKSAVLLEVEAIDEEMQQVIAELDLVNSELEKTEALLEQTSIELQTAEEKREEQYELLKLRLRRMYENGGDGYITYVLKAGNITDLINRIEYVNRIATYDKELLQKMKEIEELIAIKFEETEQCKSELTVLLGEQEEKKHSLDTVLIEKTRRLATLDANEQNYLQKINDEERESKEIEALIKKAQEEAARKAAAEAAQNAPVYKGGKLAWPVPASSRITSIYGPRKSPISGKQEFHSGIDIGVPIGNNIVAAEAGVVIMSQYYGGYGYTIIVDHGGGLSTLYAHNSKLVVSVGQSVKRGDTVAKSGNTGNSTGPHSHFEVRVNGAHTSPNSYLGI